MPKHHQIQHPIGRTTKITLPCLHFLVSTTSALRHRASSRKTLWLRLLTLNQVGNGGNYPDNPSKTRQKVPQLFVYFRGSIFSYPTFK